MPSVTLMIILALSSSHVAAVAGGVCSSYQLVTSNNTVLAPSDSASGYTDNLDCYWRIIAPANHSIVFNISQITLETCPGYAWSGCCDYVEVWDGQSTQTSGQLCNVSSGELTLAARSAWVHFHSDPSGQTFGFSMSVRFTPAVSEFGKG